MNSAKIFITLCMILAAFTGAFAAECMKGEALVVFKAAAGLEVNEQTLNDGQARKYIDGIAESADARIAAVYGALSVASGGQKILAYVVSDTKTTNELVNTLKADPRVLSASPNQQMHLNR